MKTRSPNKAVILFIKNERNCNYKFLKSPYAYDLFNSRIEKVVSEIKNNINVNIILCSDDPTLVKSDLFLRQHGKSFDNKFNNALKDAFQLGYDEVIILGNDTPELTSEQLTEAFENLSNDKVAIGPSIDGGIYLLGLTKESFHSSIKARWNTSKVRNDLIQYFYNKEIVQLKYLCDIDNESDLLSWLSAGSQYALLFQLLLAEINDVKEKEFSGINYFTTEQNLFRIHTQKAPPHLNSIS